MTDELDTKPLPAQTPKDAPPDTPQEGEPMPIEIPPGDDGLRSHVIKLTMRVTLNEARVESMGARIDSLMTPQQIEAMYQRIADETVARVETLKNDITSRFGEIAFSAAQMEDIKNKLATRATNAAESDRKLDAVIGWINIMAARDVTDSDSKAIAEPYFDAIKRLATEANALSLGIAREFSESRTDYNEGRRELKDGIAVVTAIAEDLKPLVIATAQNAQRWKAVQDAAKAVLSNPKLLLPTAALFGGGAIVTPEVLKAVWNVIVSIFTGVNQP